MCICALKCEGYTCAIACVWRSWKSLGCLHLPLFWKRFILNYICTFACLYVVILPVSAVSAEFRRGVGHLELELQAIVSLLTWVLGTKLWKNNMLLLTTESPSSCSLCIWGKISLVVCHCAVYSKTVAFQVPKRFGCLHCPSISLWKCWNYGHAILSGFKWVLRIV